MISITEKAAKKILEIADSEGFAGKWLRVKIIGGGCAGFSYDLYFDTDEPTSMDETFEDKSIKIMVDPLSFQYLDGCEIDYVNMMFGGGFIFNNPNVSSSCGCGLSVSF